MVLNKITMVGGLENGSLHAHVVPKSSKNGYSITFSDINIEF